MDHKCNTCGTTENLRTDSRGWIYNQCVSCRSKQISDGLKKTYESGIRDGKRVTEACHRKARELIKEGKFVWSKDRRTFDNWMNDPKSDRFKITIDKIRNSEYHRKGTWRGQRAKYKDVSDRVIEKQRQRYIDHPETHPNIILARKKGYSDEQKELYRIVSNVRCDAIDEGYIRVLKLNGRTTVLYPDIVIEDLKLCIEFDGGYFHKDIKVDIMRDYLLNCVGYRMLHYKDMVPSELELLSDINLILNSGDMILYKNHKGIIAA